MRGRQTLTYEALQKVMTLAEIEDVLAAARAGGADGDSVPTVRITFRGGVQQVRVEIGAAQDAPVNWDGKRDDS